MFVNLQLSSFSHAKCLNCGHLGVIDSFGKKDNPYVTFEKVPEGVEISSPMFICPICNSDDTEPLFPNEVN